jgi:sugar phosphate isomerase/epimerase
MEIAVMRGTLAPYFNTLPKEKSYKYDVKSVLSHVAQIGYAGIEMSTPPGFSNEEFKAAADEAGLRVVSAGGRLDYPELEGDDFSARIKQCKVLGAKNTMVSHMASVVLGNPEELKKFIGNLNRAGKILSDEGIHLSYHNHAIDFSKVNGKPIIEQLVEETDERYVFFEPDTHWIQAGGGHVITWLRKLKGRIYVVHFKDYAIDQYSDYMLVEGCHKLFAEVGEGNLNWPGIIKECLDQNIEWCSVEQDVAQRPVYEAIALSYKNLKAFGV